MPQLLDEHGVVGDILSRPRGIGLHQQVTAKHLRRLGLPNRFPAYGLGDLALRDLFKRRGFRDSQNRRALFLGNRKDLIDPLLGKARAGGIVNRHQIDVTLHFGQGVFHRVGTLVSSLTHLDAHDGDIRAELAVELFPVFGRDYDDHLLHIATVEKFLRRVEPHGPTGQRGEGLLVVGIAEATAGPRGGHNNGDRGHDTKNRNVTIDARGLCSLGPHPGDTIPGL